MGRVSRAIALLSSAMGVGQIIETLPPLRMADIPSGQGRRARPRSRYTGPWLRRIRAQALRFDGEPRRECARRLRQRQARS